ncbi:hypothetical protein [Prevotella amnii]|nr:hypothetical protein [Prevotella amnii]
MKKFESDSMVLDDLMEVRGGSGNTCTGILSTSSNSSDHDCGLGDCD